MVEWEDPRLRFEGVRTMLSREDWGGPRPGKCRPESIFEGMLHLPRKQPSEDRIWKTSIRARYTAYVSLSGIMPLIQYVRWSGFSKRARPDVVITQNEPILDGSFVSRQYLFAEPFQKVDLMALNKTGERMVVRAIHAMEFSSRSAACHFR